MLEEEYIVKKNSKKWVFYSSFRALFTNYVK